MCATCFVGDPVQHLPPPPLTVDQTGVLESTQVLRDERLRRAAQFRKLGNGVVTHGQTMDDGGSQRCGQGGEHLADRPISPVDRCPLFSRLLLYHSAMVTVAADESVLVVVVAVGCVAVATVGLVEVVLVLDRYVTAIGAVLVRVVGVDVWVTVMLLLRQTCHLNSSTCVDVPPTSAASSPPDRRVGHQQRNHGRCRGLSALTWSIDRTARTVRRHAGRR